MARDFYSVLGVAKGASADDIKKAYRKLSKELHPDKHKGDKAAETRFKEVNEAYEVLSNPQKKQMYDQFGHAGAGAGGFGGAGGSGGGFAGFDFSQFTGADAGSFADLFEGFFAGGGPRGRSGRRSEERGQDLETEITIDLADVVRGASRTISLKKLRTCEACASKGAEPGSPVVTCVDCGGTGQVTRTAQSFFGVIQQRTLCAKCRGSGKIPQRPCRTCDGEGRMRANAATLVNVPPGIKDGQTLRLRGEGEAGRRGAEAGDLYVHVRVKPDPRFEREEENPENVHSRATVAALDAILGVELPIETLQGSVRLRIPEGTQPGQVFRLKGKGLPVLNSGRVGDHFVTVGVEIPKKLSREERRLLEEWRETRS